MRIDRPTCNLKTCRNCFDGNCQDLKAYKRCYYKNPWIPCAATIEIPNHDVICCDKQGNVIIGMLMYLDEQWLCEDDCQMMYDVVAWTRIPEPYVEREE